MDIADAIGRNLEKRGNETVFSLYDHDSLIFFVLHTEFTDTFVTIEVPHVDMLF